ncbi:hypothetical protein Tco_1556440 [Tanacetum coccineum]
MLNTNTNLQTQTSNALHNGIMENPPYKFKWAERTIPVAEGSLETTTEGYMENYKNVSQDIRNQLMNKNEVNEIRAERLARTANPLALVAQQQPVYHPQNHPTHYTQNSSTRPQQAATRNRGKAIVNSFSPSYDQEPEMVTEDDALTSSNTSRANQDNTPRINRGAGIQCYNCKEYGHVAKGMSETKMGKGCSLSQGEDAIVFKREQLRQPESVNVTYLKEHNEYENLLRTDLIASLIEKIKCEIDESKDCNKLLESSNKILVDKLKSEIKDFKNKNKCLESSSNHFKEANTKLAKNNQLMFKDLKKFQAKLDRYHDVNYASKVEIDCAKAKGELISYKISSEKSFNEYTQKINDLKQTILEMKKELIAHQKYISIMSQEKEAQKKFYKTREDKEIEKVTTLENKVKVLDDTVYKTGQSVQTMNMLNRNCKISFVKPEFLKKAQRANPRLYDIGCYNDNLALMLALKSDETILLTQESRSKLIIIKHLAKDGENNVFWSINEEFEEVTDSDIITPYHSRSIRRI